jgi:hypothetical protein
MHSFVHIFRNQPVMTTMSMSLNNSTSIVSDGSSSTMVGRRPRFVPSIHLYSIQTHVPILCDRIVYPSISGRVSSGGRFFCVVKILFLPNQCTLAVKGHSSPYNPKSAITQRLTHLFFESFLSILVLFEEKSFLSLLDLDQMSVIRSALIYCCR